MKAAYLYILTAAVVVLAGAGAVTWLVARNRDQNKGSQSGQNSQGSQTPAASDEDTIRAFFKLINDGEPSKAALAMSAKNVNDDSTKQAWAVQFNDIGSVKATSVEPYMQSSWTDTRHEYKVNLDMSISPSAANEPIPYYGYENGSNTRFVILVKEQGSWRVDAIATGP